MNKVDRSIMPGREAAGGRVDLAALDNAGFHEIERHGSFTFRWSRPTFSVSLPRDGARFLTLVVCSEIAGNALRVDAGGQVHEIELLSNWQRIDIEIPDAAQLDFEVVKPCMPPTDARLLGVMLRELQFHESEHVHALIVGRHANALVNAREFAAGAEVIESAPPFVRITSSTTCNIANEVACVYCSWDWAKRLERDAPDFTPAFLDAMGRYFRDAQEVNDCSYGEPPLEPHFGEVVARATEAGRFFEFTSNGQTLGKRKRADIAGRPVRVYVSIDSSTARGYRRYRDHRFDRILENLKALCAEIQDDDVKPEVIVSFIVMRSNIAEIGPFVALMKDVGVDRIVFRTLYVEDHLDVRQLDHHGYQFDYDAECLGPQELRQAEGYCQAAARANGVAVTIEWLDFVVGNASQEPGEPLCSEPWKGAYVLNRGLMPCCYGRDPIVKWSEIDSENLESGLEKALNSEAMRTLRRDLAAGRLGAYCLATRSCPITKALTATGELRSSTTAPIGRAVVEPAQ